MSVLAFATLGLFGGVTCSVSFCTWTFEYLAANADDLFSSKALEVFPWGWLVTFCKDTYTYENPNEHSPWPSFQISMTYFSFTVFAAYLVREARRANLTANLGWATIGGSIICLGLMIPTMFLVKRDSLAVQMMKDKHPLDLGKAGYWLMPYSVVTAIGLASMWIAGILGDHDLTYGIALFIVALASPIAFGIRVLMDDPKTDIMPSGLFRQWVIFCAACAIGAYLFLLIGVLATNEGPSACLRNWATRTFAGDLLALRWTRCFIIARHGKMKLAALEFCFGPLGFLAWLWERAADEDAESEDTAEMVGQS